MLAETIVSFYYSAAAGKKEKEEFEKVFSQKELPQDMPIYSAGKENVDLIEVLFTEKIAPSKNEARRLLAQGAISIVESDPSKPSTVKEQILKIPTQGVVLKIGKRKFLKIIP